MAGKLIESLATPFRPKQYRDEYRANVEPLIEQKRKGRKVTIVQQPKIKPVTDIMEALKKSLQRSAHKNSSDKKALIKKKKRAA